MGQRLLYHAAHKHELKQTLNRERFRGVKSRKDMRLFGDFGSELSTLFRGLFLEIRCLWEMIQQARLRVVNFGWRTYAEYLYFVSSRSRT
ncbi:hypothetical protein PILCRDRAFT_822308 [Piloderma croceum F 1598]|jgi:hypothetical protein|uniref:Uncharacterized protein n=1 Tax=Piloderma croceum (strain F 1598) TaxID=765440 RepID=A0A0C3FLZ7_PILCF|nr:hypothetical protein PILCRDRAFT_822308 [Piloderma croceum F 1598]